MEEGGKIKIFYKHKSLERETSFRSLRRLVVEFIVVTLLRGSGRQFRVFITLVKGINTINFHCNQTHARIIQQLKVSLFLSYQQNHLNVNSE